MWYVSVRSTQLHKSRLVEAWLDSWRGLFARRKGHAGDHSAIDERSAARVAGIGSLNRSARFWLPVEGVDDVSGFIS